MSLKSSLVCSLPGYVSLPAPSHYDFSQLDTVFQASIGVVTAVIHSNGDLHLLVHNSKQDILMAGLREVDIATARLLDYCSKAIPEDALYVSRNGSPFHVASTSSPVNITVPLWKECVAQKVHLVSRQSAFHEVFRPHCMILGICP